MRCLSCNKVLSDKEATRKYATTGEFVDLCDGCFAHIEDEVPHIEGHGDDGYNDDEDGTAGYGTFEEE